MRDNFIISVEDLQKSLGSTNLRILEATFFLPNQGRDAISEFETEHIPGAYFFDIDAIADTSSDLPHMLPDANQFSKQMQALGIDEDSDIVVYDRSPFLSSARCWWMFHLFGHRSIRVLDGGFQAWKLAHGRIENGKPNLPQAGNFTTSNAIGAGHIAIDELRHIIEAGTGEQILDARPSARFAGDVPEPRPGVASGHMPGAYNLPITQILADNGSLKSNGKLTKLFSEAGIDLSQPIITTCGSGVTAAGLTLGLAVLGVDTVRLYDGSWAEWGSQTNTAIEKGQTA